MCTDLLRMLRKTAQVWGETERQTQTGRERDRQSQTDRDTLAVPLRGGGALPLRGDGAPEGAQRGKWPNRS